MKVHASRNMETKLDHPEQLASKNTEPRLHSKISQGRDLGDIEMEDSQDVGTSSDYEERDSMEDEDWDPSCSTPVRAR